MGNDLHDGIPRSLQSLRQKCSNGMSHTKEFIVCPKCVALYSPDNSSEGVNESKCSHVEYPNHPHRNKRTPCNTLLIKRVKCGHMYRFVPKMTFVYNSVTEVLKKQWPDMLKLCNEWRNQVCGDE